MRTHLGEIIDPFYRRVMALLFQLQPEEVGRVTWMFFYSFWAVGAFVLGRIVRDTLLLSLPPEKGLAQLPLLMGGSALSVSLIAYLYSRYAQRLRRDKMIMAVNGLLTLALLLLYALLCILPRAYHPPILQANYLYIEVMGALQVIQFWTLASELFDARSAKRCFAIVGGGAVLANLLAFGLRPLLGYFAQPFHLLLLVAAMMLLCILVVWRLGLRDSVLLDALFMRQQSQPIARSKRMASAIRVSADTERISTDPHLRHIAILVFLTFFSTTLLDYQFKAIAAQTYRDAELLGAYLSSFYGITGILACAMQFVFANRILGAWGIRNALLFLPLTLLGGSLSFAFSPWLLSGIVAVTLMKGSENVLRYTLYDVSLNLLYIPVSSSLRARAKAFLDGILKPASIGLCALFLWYASRAGWEVRHLSWIAVGCLGLWIAVIFRGYRAYLVTLASSLRRERLPLGSLASQLEGEAAVAVFHRILREGDAAEIRDALGLMQHLSLKVLDEKELALLLKRPEAEVQIALMRLLATQGGRYGQQAIRLSCEHKDASVRAEAILALCASVGQEAVSLATQALREPALAVRSASIVGLFRHGGLDGILAACSDLKAMLEATDALERQEAASILARLAIRDIYQPLHALLHDAEPSVQQAALHAIGRLRPKAFLPLLLDALQKPLLARSASRAIIQYGEEAYPLLKEHLLNPQSAPIHNAILRCLAALDLPDVPLLLLERLALSSLPLHQATLRAFQRIHQRHPLQRSEYTRLHKLIEQTLIHYARWFRHRRALHDILGEEERLFQSIDEQIALLQRQILTLLDLCFQGKKIDLIIQQYLAEDTRKRANALELLDNILQSHPLLRRQILALLEGGAALERVVASLCPMPLVEEEPLLAWFAHQDSPWLASCLVMALLEREPLRGEERWESFSQHPASLVRETTVFAAIRFLPPEQALSIAEAALGDPEPFVQAYACLQLKRLHKTHKMALSPLLPCDHTEELPTMLSTFERILFLKSVDLFQRLSNDDLAYVAQIAQEVGFDRGDEIIREGEIGDALYILVEGSVEVCKGSMQLAILREKEPFGEMGILDSEPRSATVRALDDLLLLRIDRDAFDALMEERMEIARSVIHVLLQRLRLANATSASQAQLNAVHIEAPPKPS